MPFESDKQKRFFYLCKSSRKKAKGKCPPKDVVDKFIRHENRDFKMKNDLTAILAETYLRNKLNESAKRSISRMIRHLDSGGAVGVISAHRHENSPAENNKRMRSLRADLKSRGLTAIPQHGTYPESTEGGGSKDVHEKSFRIHHHDAGELTKHLKELGHKYNQDSVGIHTKAEGMKFHATKSGGEDFHAGHGMKIGPDLADKSSSRYSMYRSSTANPKKPKKGKPFSYGS